MSSISVINVLSSMTLFPHALNLSIFKFVFVHSQSWSLVVDIEQQKMRNYLTEEYFDKKKTNLDLSSWSDYYPHDIPFQTVSFFLSSFVFRKINDKNDKN